MACSVVNNSNINAIIADMINKQPEESEALNELSSELLDPEILKAFTQRGALQGESKVFVIIPDKYTPPVQKINTCVENTLKAHMQCESSNLPCFFSLYKESAIRTPFSYASQLASPKEKPSNENSLSKEAVKENAPLKSSKAPQQNMEKPLVSKQLQQMHENKNIHNARQGISHSLERLVKNTLAPKSQNTQETQRKHSEERQRVRQDKAREEVAYLMHRLEKNKNEEREQEERKHKQEEEGFAEQQERHSPSKKEEQQEQDKIKAVTQAFNVELTTYGFESSLLSEIIKMRVSQFDVLLLFIEILKLEIRGKEQERIARGIEREFQLLHMQQVVDNYKSQGKWLMFSSIGSGVLAIVSGTCPILSHATAGNWILDNLKMLFSSLNSLKKDQFFKSVGKITYAMSEMYKSTGQIHNTFSEGKRTYEQHLSDLHRSDWEENTRTMEEIKDSWKGIENFLYQTLQMYHETIRQLYSH